MADLHFELTGLPEVRGRLAELLVAAERSARELIADTVLFAERTIVDKITEFEAVDTGRLKGSISSKMAFSPGDTATSIAPDGMSATLGTNVEYALPVHEGYVKKLQTKVRSAYGVTRGRLTKLRVSQAEQAGKIGRSKSAASRQKTLLISRATYAKSAETGDISMYVKPRPFVADAVPEIEEHFKETAVEIFARLGIQLG